MDLGLEGKTALVTGASSHGIGRAIAKALAAEGVQLCVAARRRELLDELAGEIVAAGGKKPCVVAVDLLNEDGPAKLAQQALAGLGRIGILMNCAGGGGGRFAVDTPEEVWVREVNLNFTSVRKLTLAVVPDMITNNWGRIISITGKSEPPRGGLYGASAPKAAMHGFSKGLSNAVGRNGITVNCIAPGKIMSEQIRRKHDEGERKAFAEEQIPVGRYGEPEELARLAVFLASPYSGFITGTVIPVDGGLRHYAF
jgi:3-oxoacyl-[acyl-carrier protein] reductase